MPFVKGQSGNPGGVTKISKDIKALAQSFGPKAVRTLAGFLDHEDAAIATRAADILLDRGYGKPAQAIDSTLTLEAGDTLTALLDKIRSGHASEPLGRPVVEVGELVQLPDGGGRNGHTLPTEARADGPLDAPDYEATRTPLRHKEQAFGG